MNRTRIQRVLIFLFAILFFAVNICVAFAIAAQAGCCAKENMPCLNLAKLQQSLRQLTGLFSALAGLWVLFISLPLMFAALFGKPHIASLVTLKTRLNN